MSEATTTGDRVAVCGLGAMGAGIAHRLLDMGLAVSVWNRTPERAEELVAAGAEIEPTPACAAAEASTVFVCVADDEAARTVLSGEGGVLTGLPEDAVMVLACTVSPETAAELAELAAPVRMLDVGMLGNSSHARQGELRLYVGGASETVVSRRRLLETLAKQVLHVGASGQGMRLKLVINLIMGVEMQVMAEAAALGTGGGLDRSVVLDAIAESGFASPVMAFKARRMRERRYDAPDFRLRLMAKDLALALAQGHAAMLDLPVTSAAFSTHRAATDAGLGDADCAAIERHLAPAAPKGGAT